MAVSSDPHVWLQPYFARLREDPAFGRLAPSFQFEELCAAVELAHPQRRHFGCSAHTLRWSDGYKRGKKPTVKERAMAKKQRRYVIGKTYYIEGVSELYRQMKFVGRLKMGGKRREHLVFRPLRKMSKLRSA